MRWTPDMMMTYFCPLCRWRYSREIIAAHFRAHHLTGDQIGQARWMTEEELRSWRPGEDRRPDTLWGEDDEQMWQWNGQIFQACRSR